MEIKNMAVIGLGGIGSHFIEILTEYMKKPMFIDGLDKIEKITFIDYDIIEYKNLAYCKVTDELSLGQNKALHYYNRHKDLKQLEKPVTVEIRSTKELDKYDFIVLCVDNNKVRNIVHKTKKPYLDMRATGGAIYVNMIIDKKEREGTHLEDKGVKAGCQRELDINTGNIQLGNVISATLGVQLLLNFIRERETKRHHRFMV